MKRKKRENRETEWKKKRKKRWKISGRKRNECGIRRGRGGRGGLCPRLKTTLGENAISVLVWRRRSYHGSSSWRRTPFNIVEDVASRAHRSSSLWHVSGDERLPWLSKGKGREAKAPPDNGPEPQGFQARRPGFGGPVVCYFNRRAIPIIFTFRDCCAFSSHLEFSSPKESSSQFLRICT